VNDLREDIKRQIRFNLQEICSALDANDIQIHPSRVAQMKVGDLIAVLTHENIGVVVGAYVRPYDPNTQD